MRSDALDGPKKTGKDVDPWETCNGYAKKHTEDLCESWRDEVDKLLIFVSVCMISFVRRQNTSPRSRIPGRFVFWRRDCVRH